MSCIHDIAATLEVLHLSAGEFESVFCCLFFPLHPFVSFSFFLFIILFYVISSSGLYVFFFLFSDKLLSFIWIE